MISADTMPTVDAVEKLVVPFADGAVGMTSGHIIPVNTPDTFLGFYATVFWRLHHEIALRGFKAGEAVAWRNVIDRIHPETSTDETNIAALIINKGLRTVYVPDAIVYNRGPETLSDYIAVRRRHIAAYYHLREKAGLSYLPETMNTLLVLKLYFTVARPANFKEGAWLIAVIANEALGRIAAWYDWRIQGDHHPIWPTAGSTKTLPPNL